MTIHDAEVKPMSQAVISELAVAHADAVRPMTIRRRSVTAAMTASLLASWSVVEDRLDDHLLVTMSVLRPAPDDGLTGAPDRVLFETLLDGVRRWLEEFAVLQAITWQASPAMMARTLLATFDGLIADYAATRDAEGARQLVSLLGYHLAQSGLRHTKVPPRGQIED